MKTTHQTPLLKLTGVTYKVADLFGYPVRYVELIATLFGLLSIYLAARQIIWTWPVGVINIIFSFVVFYQVQLYADMFLQVFFLCTNIWGWVIWKGHLREEKPVRKLSAKTRSILSGVIIVSTYVLGTLVKNVHLLLPQLFDLAAAFPFVDTFIAVASITASILLAERFIENWRIWIIVDIICVFVYASKNIIFISFEYFVFCLLACFAFFSWLKSMKHKANASSQHQL
jgi:nicotinamide mononucleotide transporter